MRSGDLRQKTGSFDCTTNKGNLTLQAIAASRLQRLLGMTPPGILEPPVLIEAGPVNALFAPRGSAQPAWVDSPAASSPLVSSNPARSARAAPVRRPASTFWPRF